MEFNATEYFKNLIAKNKLAKEKDFVFTTAPSLYDLQDVAYNSRADENFFVFIETTTGTIDQRAGGGFFNDKQFNAAILMRFEVGNETDRLEKLRTMRRLQSQILSKMINDSYSFDEQALEFFDVSRTTTEEVSEFYFAGLCAMWFTFSLDSPKELKYDEDEWDE